MHSNTSNTFWYNLGSGIWEETSQRRILTIKKAKINRQKKLFSRVRVSSHFLEVICFCSLTKRVQFERLV
jgi:hypothetical protein